MDNEKTSDELPLLAPVKILSKEDLMKEYPNKETIEKARETVEFLQIYSPADEGIIRVENIRHFPPLIKDRITQVVPREEYDLLERERDGLRALVQKAHDLFADSSEHYEWEAWLKAKEALSKGEVDVSKD